MFNAHTSTLRAIGQAKSKVDYPWAELKTRGIVNGPLFNVLSHISD